MPLTVFGLLSAGGLVSSTISFSVQAEKAKKEARIKAVSLIRMDFMIWLCFVLRVQIYRLPQPGCRLIVTKQEVRNMKWHYSFTNCGACIMHGYTAAPFLFVGCAWHGDNEGCAVNDLILAFNLQPYL
jgi:hypothetical protein